jgi:hypothetical protein
MTKLYTYDMHGNYTGQLDHVRFQAVPVNSTRIAPPEIADGQYLIFAGRWYIKDAPIMPPEPRAEVPQAVSMRQARLALLGAGLLDTVETAIASMEGAEGRAARIEWEYAQEVRKDSPLIDALAPALGLTTEQTDHLFMTAATL